MSRHPLDPKSRWSRLVSAYTRIRTALYHGRRIVTGRAALHLVDGDGNTRLTLDARRSR